jgi:sec-independent protein translocase protein TatA
MGTFSLAHMIIVLVIVLLLFGNRLPSVMRSLGRGVTEFKKGLAGEDDPEGTAGKDEKSIKKDEPEKLP